MKLPSQNEIMVKIKQKQEGHSKLETQILRSKMKQAQTVCPQEDTPIKVNSFVHGSRG
jgi:hypothetical protein